MRGNEPCNRASYRRHLCGGIATVANGLFGILFALPAGLCQGRSQNPVALPATT